MSARPCCPSPIAPGSTGRIFAPHGRVSLPLAQRARRRPPDFRRRLLRWFRRHGRDLPWRRTRDPYHIVVSEFMLQQTQVSRVEAYYHRFLERYPDHRRAGGGAGGEVRESWEGLGYYRRAANLHRLAQAVVREHAGVIPADPALLLAAARRRALHGGGGGQLRLRAGDAGRGHQRRAGDPPGVPSRGCAGAAARSARSGRRPPAIIPRRGEAAWAFNQAIMELGALVCTARVARCGECPVRTACATGW